MRWDQSNVSLKAFSELLVHEDLDGEEGRELILFLQGHKIWLITVVEEHSCARLELLPSSLHKTNAGENAVTITEIFASLFA